jgi:hypothetical protein
MGVVTRRTVRIQPVDLSIIMVRHSWFCQILHYGAVNKFGRQVAGFTTGQPKTLLETKHLYRKVFLDPASLFILTNCIPPK